MNKCIKDAIELSRRNSVYGFMSREDHGGYDENYLKRQFEKANLISNYENLLEQIKKTKAEITRPYDIIENQIIEKINKIRNEP